MRFSLSIATVCLLSVCHFASAASKPAVADNYLDLTVTYSIYAKTIWHDADS